MDGSSRVENDWVLQVDVTGVVEESLDVSVRDSVLRVQGRRRVGLKGYRIKPVVGERLYGRFLRLLRLPAGLDARALKFKVENAWLEVRVPRRMARGGIW